MGLQVGDLVSLLLGGAKGPYKGRGIIIGLRHDLTSYVVPDCHVWVEGTKDRLWDVHWVFSYNLTFVSKLTDEQLVTHENIHVREVVLCR